jgi:acetyltransferase-like isoleucine patch superfamily enzyme
VEIGENVWICGGVTITGGVRFGSNSIIGAGSVVIRDIPDNVLAAGNPARIIREITDEDRISARS